MGRKLESNRYYDETIADYTRAIKNNPNDAETYCNRGIAYWTKRDKSRAREDWKKALEIDPNNESARKYLALQ
jgi:Flp pilus assembly protein TadD